MKYKLVPVKPTPEMIHAGQMAVSGFPRDVLERWEAMLAAAPDFDRHVIAEVNEDDDGYWADILPGQSVHLGQPLYGVMQPTPDVAKLVEVLDEMIDVAKAVDSWESFPSAPIDRAQDALESYRQQGGSK